jgi:transposase
MENYTYVGLDLSKTSTMATAVDSLGHRIRQEKLGVTDEELLRFLGEIPGPKQVVMEACNVWEHTYDAAASTGANVLLANPLKVKLVSKTTLKTDKVDSEKLALLARLNAIPESYAPSPEQRALRRLVRERVFYHAKWKAVANHTYALLLQKGIPYRPEILTRRRLRGELRVHNIVEVNRGLDTLEKIEEVSVPLDREIHRAYLASREAQLLATIPGVGEFTSMTLVAFLCPIERFYSLDAVVKYCGLCPSVRQSGERAYHGRLVWDCNVILKWVLIEGQWNVRLRERKGDVSRVARRVARRGATNDGAVAAARKLVRICAAILRRGTPYQLESPESSSRQVGHAAS